MFRRKTKLHIFLICAICICVLVISIFTSKEHYASKNIKFSSYTVQQNDTLWKIAKEIRPDQDPRKTVYQIQKINDITPVIQPGQEILVPQK
jgi:LysM repeat protein